MKVPKARRLPSGKWFIQLRLGGESIPITTRTEKECIRQAQYIKAEYQAGKRISKEEKAATLTLSEAIDKYIAARGNILSPSTVGGYRCIQRTKFKSIMHRRLGEIPEKEWQKIVNQEAALCSPKTLKNAFAFVRSVIQSETGQPLPPVQQGVPIPKRASFLQPEEIPIFVAAVTKTPYALASLLALSSMRVSEIWALNWEDIPPHPDFIRCNGAVVKDEHGQMIRKSQNKNETSTRNVPILIPELSEIIEKERKPSGPIILHSQSAFRVNLRKICEQAKITPVTPHGLRHSYASLAYHLQIPERVAADIGGWSDFTTMRRIYTHVAQSDIKRYQNELAAFYKKEKHKK